jgi:hypothetical protein
MGCDAQRANVTMAAKGIKLLEEQRLAVVREM